MSDYPNPTDFLAHRSPFLFCDEITELEPGVSCTALWHLSGEEAFFSGHFPGQPTLPGVLMLEALEATAVLLSFAHKQIPPTVGYKNPDPEMAEFNLVSGSPRDWVPGPSLSNSFGFGGHNGSIVLSPVDC